MSVTSRLLASLPLAFAAACAPQSDGLDLVLVGIDTLRADHLSLYGYERETSPNLDAFAAGGTVFERAYAGSSWTLPSMAMLWTGRWRHDNGGELSGEPAGIAERLAVEGYRTYGVVSNALLHPDKGWDRGFDRYEVYRPDGRSRANGWPAGEVVRRGVAWLDQVGTRDPRFLFLFLFDPHDPYRPVDGERFAPFDREDRFVAFERALPPDRRAAWSREVYEGIERRIALYDSEIAEADAALGELYRYLEAEGRMDRTVFAFFSDHGEGLWQRARLTGENDKAFAYFPELYFDHGVMLYEEQVRVPLVLRGPGVPNGARVADPVATVDLVPTLMGLLDLERVGELSGLDLLDADTRAGREDLVAFTSRGASVLMDGRFRLHVPRAYRAERDGAQPELFDLERDPLELEPFEDPALLERGLARLEAWRLHESAPAQPLDPAEQARLEALGYVGGEADR